MEDGIMGSVDFVSAIHVSDAQKSGNTRLDELALVCGGVGAQHL
jgi:hypothetical protein